MHLPNLTGAFGLALLTIATSSAAAEATAPSAAAVTHFEKEIRPVLATQCIKCHGEKKQEGNLRLDSRAALIAGGDSGPAIVPGKPDESLLIEALHYESFEMPPTGQLEESIIRQFEIWVANQAAWPEQTGPLREVTGIITEADRQWWAFQPLRQPEPPQAHGDLHAETDIDRFVYRRLVEHDLRPAPEADKGTLIRRLYFDVIGLPPSPAEIEEFLQDDSEQAWENLVDKLLADPRYGEHWARYWLDLVRFSESDGWNQDAYRPNIWRYRDYVVHAFNEDKPYPQFVREQLAGDEILTDDPTPLAAVGFLRLGIYEYNQRDARGHWNDIMNEMTDVAGDVFLGISMACARCHDHKFDPILQTDYFQLRAFFEPVIWRDDLVAATQQQKLEYEKQLDVWEAASQEVRAKVDDLLQPYFDRKWESTVDKFPLDIQACFHKPVEERTSWEHQMAYLVSRQFEEEGGGPLKSLSKEDKATYEALQKELAAFDDLKPKPLPHVMTVTDFDGSISPTEVPDIPGEALVGPGFPVVLADGAEAVPSEAPSRSTGRRTALAEWIGQPDNPLTTRVIVNRIWQQHFGQGLVTTPSDFGHNGQPPTHPELLDWLTVTFIEDGWSFKKLHKRILMSATWRQSTVHPDAEQYQNMDPADELLWRSRIRRLRAEQIRDAMLTASGELSESLGGPSVDEPKPRRSLYVKSFRNKSDTFLHAFDVAAGLKSVAERNTTTTPTQSLLMINGDYALERARKMADRLQAKSFENGDAMLRYAFQLAWARPPSSHELQQALEFTYPSTGEDSQKLDKERLVDFCHVLFNSNEFLYVD